MLADPFQFALYLAHLSQSSKTRAPVEETQELAVVEDPADHPLVKQILADIKHISAQKTTKIAPITPEILRRTYAKFVTPSAELPVIYTMTKQRTSTGMVLGCPLHIPTLTFAR